MDAQSHRFARLRVFACSLTLAGMILCPVHDGTTFAFDHPAPSDTSTRKGAVTSDASSASDLSLEESAREPSIQDQVKQTPKSPIESKSAAKEIKNNQANVTFAQWVSDWMKNPRKVTAKLAIHGVVPEIELEAVIPASQQKICANGKCYDVDDKQVEGQPCDQQATTDPAAEQEQISEAPVAPPVPPSFPFALHGESPEASILELQIDGGPYSQGFLASEYPQQEQSPQDIYGALSEVQIALPASTLVAYMVAHAENTIRLEMTEQLAAERAMYAQRYELLLQHNQQLQTQLAVIEARQQTTEAMALRATGRPLASYESPEHKSLVDVVEDQRCQSLTASREDWDAIQEDLSNIRRQIAILKKNGPIPFAASSIGAEVSPNDQPNHRPNLSKNPGVIAKQPQAWRTARSTPYVPVFPSVGKSPETSKK